MNLFFDEPVFNNEIDRARDIIEGCYLQDDSPIILGFSGGKDSTLLAQLFCEVTLKHGCKRRLIFLYHNTRVEYESVLERIETEKKRIVESNLNASFHIIIPTDDQTIWSYIIGRGYPVPTQKMSYCSIKLKEYPSRLFERNIAVDYRCLITAFGIRKEESKSREERMNLQGAPERLYNRNKKYSIYEFCPIADVKTEELWEYLRGLGTFAWGETYEELRTLYPESEGGDRARKGCWCCTKFSEGKECNFGDEPEDRIRRFLRQIDDDPKKRNICRTRRQREVLAEGKASGYFTMEARREILDYIQEEERKSGKRFITDGELEFIKKRWERGYFVKEEEEDLDLLDMIND